MMIYYVKVKGLDANYVPTIVIGLTVTNSYIVRLCAVGLIVASLVHFILLASLFQTIFCKSIFCNRLW
jgi:hypothetical protein